MRNPNFDFLKGFLIILVVIGHLIHGHVEDNFTRWLIYGFHMPLFIAISGYMFSSVYNRQVSFTELFSKYKVRLIFPWLLAVLLYWLYINYGDFKDGEQNQPIYINLIRPYYHLWFVCGLLSWMFTTWFAKRLGLSLGKLFVISAVVSVLWLVMMKYNLDSGVQQPVLKVIRDFFYYAYRPQHYVFFVGGLYLKEHPITLSNKVCISLILVGFAGRVALYYYQSQPVLFILNYFELNVALVLFLFKKAMQQPWFNSKLLQWLGINSFGVYLWHIIPLLTVHQIIYMMGGSCQLWLHYSMDAVLLCVTLGTIFLMSKNKFTSTYLIGMKKNNN
ncbi:MAG: acyltransferase family protein [Paludibacteraceae bacterium]|nr:acyltransferase family protein [Paludibacteraceae bacterium]